MLEEIREVFITKRMGVSIGIAMLLAIVMSQVYANVFEEDAAQVCSFFTGLVAGQIGFLCGLDW